MIRQPHRLHSLGQALAKLDSFAPYFASFSQIRVAIALAFCLVILPISYYSIPPIALTGLVFECALVRPPCSAVLSLTHHPHASRIEALRSGRIGIEAVSCRAIRRPNCTLGQVWGGAKAWTMRRRDLARLEPRLRKRRKGQT